METIIHDGKDECGNEIIIHIRNEKHLKVIDDIGGTYYGCFAQNGWGEWLYYGPHDYKIVSHHID